MLEVQDILYCCGLKKMKENKDNMAEHPKADQGDESAEQILSHHLEEDDRFVFYPFPPPSEGNGEPSTSHHTQPLLMYLARDKKNQTIKAVKGDKTSLQLDTETIPQNLWPAAAPFALWILNRPELFKGKHILELGSGVGLAGLAAACTGAASVTLTDISAVSLAMIKLGVKKSQTFSAKSRMFVQNLAWGCADSYRSLQTNVFPHLSDRGDKASITHFDLVIGCDVFYFNTSLVSGLKTAGMALGENDLDGEPRDFYCASVVRSERMDSDLEVIPGRQGFSGGELLDTGSRNGLPEDLRLFKWSLSEEK